MKRSIALELHLLGSLTLLLGAQAWALADATTPPPGVPYFYEYCGVTQLHSPIHKGTTMGHAVAYVQGLCKDYSAEYPQVKLCTDEDAKDPLHPHDGVGLSANGGFANVNWTAIPSRTLFYHGLASPAETVSEDSIAPLQKRAYELDIFKGVTFHPERMDGGDLNEFAADSDGFRRVVTQTSIATDMALDYGRTGYCIRIPLEKEELIPMRNHLNEINQYFHDQPDGFKMAGTQNCSHLAFGVLSASGLVRSKKIPKDYTTPGVSALNNISSPYNELAYLLKQSFIKDETALSDRAGITAWSFPPHAQNSFFDLSYVRARVLPTPEAIVNRYNSILKRYFPAGAKSAKSKKD